MEDCLIDSNITNEKAICDHGKPIPFEKLLELKKKSENATCIINTKNTQGTGFFLKYNFSSIKEKYFLMTNNHVIDLTLNQLRIIYKGNDVPILLNKR